jgi:uncharacterized Tic20 family protein
MTNPHETNPSNRNMAMLCHLLTFTGYLVPLANFIAPLVLWFTKKDESQFIDEHGKQMLNFQISVFIWTILCVPLCFIIIGFFLLFALFVVDLVCTIIGAVKAQNGEYYTYPITIQFLR